MFLKITSLYKARNDWYKTFYTYSYAVYIWKYVIGWFSAQIREKLLTLLWGFCWNRHLRLTLRSLYPILRFWPLSCSKSTFLFFRSNKANNGPLLMATYMVELIRMICWRFLPCELARHPCISNLTFCKSFS